MMTLLEKVLSAIDNPSDWEITGLLQDVAEELERHKNPETDISDLVKKLPMTASERFRRESVQQAKARDKSSMLDRCQHVIDVCREMGIKPSSLYSSAGGSHVCLDRAEFDRAFPENQAVEVAANGIVFICFED